jgi:glycosyltransferase involved in cell wall biosynthesis
MIQMADKGKTLIFFTDTFPCGNGEAFIENEFPFLAAAFGQIIIVTNNLTDSVSRQVTANVKVTRFAYTAPTIYKLLALGGVFESFIRRELGFITGNLKLNVNKQRLSILFGSYAKALETEKFLDNLIKQEALDGNNLFLYSYWMNDMAGGLAYFKYHHPNVKAFCRAHRWDIYLEKQPARYLPFKNFVVEQLDACYTISQDGGTYIQALTAHRFDTKIKLARLGTLNTKQPRQVFNAGKLVIVSCSNVIERKRLHLIINALSQIDDIEISWTHIGEGPLRKEIEALAASELGNKQNISYRFAGQMGNKQLLEYYAGNIVDLFINVSESEGVPVSIMEANSFGIPAVATNTGGVAELVDDGSGFLLEVDSSSKTIAETIMRYYGLSDEAKQNMRSNAYKVWNTKYNAQNNYKEFVADILAL